VYLRVLNCIFYVFRPFRNIVKGVIRFAMSVCPSTSNNSAPNEGIFIKFDMCIFWNICSENSNFINHLTSELNFSVQRCLTRFFTGDFVLEPCTFINICVKTQQMQQLFTQFINYISYLLHVSALHCHPQTAFLVPSERCSIEEQSLGTTRSSAIFYRLLFN
jgi:hypothetical protein